MGKWVHVGAVSASVSHFSPPHTTRRFATPQPRSEASDVHMRCLVRYASGAVKQSVVPPGDWRMSEAMAVHGVKATVLPPEPRWACGEGKGVCAYVCHNDTNI